MKPSEKTDDTNPNKCGDDDKETNGTLASSDIRHLNPVKKSHNMDDLKTLDFNSADEIRQTMKAVFAGQRGADDAEICGTVSNKATNNHPDTKSQGCPHSPIPNQMLHKTVQIEAKDNPFQSSRNRSSARDYRRKRPGRPPKAGTSKRLKNPSVSAMYVGKLSNVVPFKRRRYESESESDDLDSMVMMY